MKYVLLNRENVVVDILDYVRYVKLQSSNGFIVGCEEKEATGVIGSDCNTHYTLVKADTLNSIDAVVVKEMERIPSYVKVGLYKYDAEQNLFVDRYTLDEAKVMKQEENKLQFAEYLATHPLTWTDGKQYGITEADQSEISLNLNQYQVALSAGVDAPTLEWHAKHEESKPWSLEQLSALSLAISEAVYPQYHKMQQYKTRIYSCGSLEELALIEIKYEE